VIQIDVHPAGENPTNTPCMLPTPVHARPMYTFCGQSSYVTTLHWLLRSRNKPLHPEDAVKNKDRLAQLSSWVASFLLPCDSSGVGERGFGLMITQLLQLSRPYHEYAIDILNTCSRGSTRQSLTDTGGGYNLGGAGLPHTTHRPSQLAVSTFHPRALPGLQFNQVLPTKPRCRV
jgi:hypothetical protein